MAHQGKVESTPNPEEVRGSVERQIPPQREMEVDDDDNLGPVEMQIEMALIRGTVSILMPVTLAILWSRSCRIDDSCGSLEFGGFLFQYPRTALLYENGARAQGLCIGRHWFMAG